MCGVVTSETFAVAYLEFPLSLARRRSNSLSSKTGREFVEKVGKRAKKKKRNESWEESKKKKKGMTGEGERNEGNACPQTSRF